MDVAAFAEPGPRGRTWREGTLTRPQELAALCSWVVANHPKRATGCLGQRHPRASVCSARPTHHLTQPGDNRRVALVREVELDTLLALRDRALTPGHPGRPIIWPYDNESATHFGM